jgi:hypothetical protein
VEDGCIRRDSFLKMWLQFGGKYDIISMNKVKGR